MGEGWGLAVGALVVLAIGAFLGLASRLILRGRSTMTVSGSVVAGIVGASVGGILAGVATSSSGSARLGPVFLASALSTLVVLVVAERFVHHPELSATQLIEAGESARVEFKSTARFSFRNGQRDERIEAAVARSVAAFLNADGGTLLVGVDDSGNVLGLDADLALMKNPDIDRFELWLHDFLTRVIGAPAVALVRVAFPDMRGRTICRIDVAASPRPVFIRLPKTEDVAFVVRLGNSSRQLGVADAIDYAADHFRRPRRLRPPSADAQTTR